MHQLPCEWMNPLLSAASTQSRVPPLPLPPSPPLPGFRLTCHWVPCGVMVVVSAGDVSTPCTGSLLCPEPRLQPGNAGAGRELQEMTLAEVRARHGDTEGVDHNTAASLEPHLKPVLMLLSPTTPGRSVVKGNDQSLHRGVVAGWRSGCCHRTSRLFGGRRTSPMLEGCVTGSCTVICCRRRGAALGVVQGGSGWRMGMKIHSRVCVCERERY